MCILVPMTKGSSFCNYISMFNFHSICKYNFAYTVWLLKCPSLSKGNAGANKTNHVFYENRLKQTTNGASPVKTNKLDSQIPKSEILRNVFQVLAKESFIFICQVLSKGSFLKTCLNYSSCFPEGVPKEEIKQWRRARSRPGEKETLNIMLMENTLKTYTKLITTIGFVSTCNISV